MPRNRIDVDRESKVEEILIGAERMLRVGGYNALSMNALAQELGLRRGAIHWYFRTKDELFVAAAQRMINVAFSEGPDASDYRGRIRWAVDQLAELSFLIRALHERARHVDAARELELHMEKGLCTRLRTLLKSHVPAKQLDEAAHVIVTFAEGLLSSDASKRTRHRRLEFLLQHIVPDRDIKV